MLRGLIKFHCGGKNLLFHGNAPWKYNWSLFTFVTDSHWKQTKDDCYGLINIQIQV